jgi:CubicO group peptidase (beta-lactamase class C family)
VSAGGEELRALVEHERIRFGANALSIVVVAAGDVLVADGFGLRDVEQDLPATAQTLFAIASDTKAFVAAACAVLVDDGLLEWDRPVREYLPEFRLMDSSATELVTVRDLLSHRTGLPRHDALNVWGGARLPLDEVVRRLRHLQPSAPLRQTWQYNNLAYVTAGHLLGVLTGSDWTAVVQERLLDPLGMSSTCFDRAVAEKTGDYAVGYSDAGPVPLRSDGRRGPAGGILSNAEDMSRWVLARLGRPTPDGRRVLSDSALRELHTPAMVEPAGFAAFPEVVKTGYGLAASMFGYRGLRVVHHGGNIDGFACDVLLAPDAGHAVVVLSNATGSGVRDALPLAVLDRLTGLDPLPWGERWDSSMGSIRAGMVAAREHAQAQGAEPAPPPRRSLEDLAGRYSHPAYDLLEVSVTDGALQVAWHDIDGITVRHRGADVWDLVVPGYEMALTLAFRSGPHGVEDVLVPLEPSVDAVVFRRLAPELPEQDEARLLGTYAMGELRLHVAREADGLVADVRGMVRLPLEPRSATRFTVPGRSGVLAEFLGTATRPASRVVLTPYGVFERADHV